MPVYELFQQFNEFANVISGEDWKSQPYFTHYFNGTVFPKFALYSAHAETVHPLLVALGMSTIGEVPEASGIFIDYFTNTNTGEDRVRAIFRPDPLSADKEEVLLGGDLSLTDF